MSEALARPRIGVFGGTFDPVHHGHLRMALELSERLRFERLNLVPCNIPSHREAPLASPAQRLAMLQLAIDGCDRLALDDCELRRGGVSYAIDTLRSLREGLGAHPALCLILGADAFAGLPGWKQWQQLIDYAHILVLERPGSRASLSPVLQEWSRDHAAEDAGAALDERAAGSLIRLELTQLAISASEIRNLQATGRSMRFLLPETVREYINRNRLYVTDRPPEGDAS